MENDCVGDVSRNMLPQDGSVFTLELSGFLRCDTLSFDEWLLCSEGWRWLHLHGHAVQEKYSSWIAWPLKIKAIWSFRTSGITHSVTQCHIPEDTNPERTLCTLRLINQTSTHGIYSHMFSELFQKSDDATRNIQSWKWKNLLIAIQKVI
jgi:hypothetical protein